jgi:hypothetical protein
MQYIIKTWIKAHLNFIHNQKNKSNKIKQLFMSHKQAEIWICSFHFNQIALNWIEITKNIHLTLKKIFLFKVIFWEKKAAHLFKFYIKIILVHAHRCWKHLIGKIKKRETDWMQISWACQLCMILIQNKDMLRIILIITYHMNK